MGIFLLLVNSLLLMPLQDEPPAFHNPLEIKSIKDFSTAAQDTAKNAPAKEKNGDFKHSHVSKKRIPAGAILNITAEFPGTVYLDQVKIRKITPNHVLFVENTPVGSHTLSFLNESMNCDRNIDLRAGEVHNLKLQRDKTISDSVTTGSNIRGRHQKISAIYQPFKRYFSFQALPGFAFNGRGSGFNGRIIASLGFSRKKIGIGAGIVNYATHFSKGTGTAIAPSYDRSEDFGITVIPVFVDFSFALAKKRAEPFISVDLGVSIPVTQQFSCGFSRSGPGYYPYLLTINKINTGIYFGSSMGVKYYISPTIEVAVSFGFDLSNNHYTGGYYHKTEPGLDSGYSDAHTSSGWILGATVCYNLKR